jgi:hypothetical protein
MNATFQVQEISRHHNGDVAVVLRQVYDHTTKQVSDSVNPDGEINLVITDRSDFFLQGQKYLVNFRNTAPPVAVPAAQTAPQKYSLANMNQGEYREWLKKNPGRTQTEYVAYKNANAKAVSAEEEKLRKYLLANHKSETRNETPVDCAIRLLAQKKAPAPPAKK